MSWDDSSSRAIGEWLLGHIVEASKLGGRHQFDQPRQFKGAGGAARIFAGLVSLSSMEGCVARALNRIRVM
ncbi:MAG: hypothetical protein ACRYFU_23855 [Janthinobacterium lividum]